MKYKLKCVIAISFLSFSVTSVAGVTGWGVESEISRLVVSQKGDVSFRLSPELSGCDGIGGFGEKYGTLSKEHPGFEELNSYLLTAFMSKMKVQLYFEDNKCTVSEIVMGGTYY